MFQAQNKLSLGLLVNTRKTQLEKKKKKTKIRTHFPSASGLAGLHSNASDDVTVSSHPPSCFASSHFLLSLPARQVSRVSVASRERLLYDVTRSLAITLFLL